MLNKRLLIFIIIILSLSVPIIYAWFFPVTYPYRLQIISNSTTEYTLSINDTYGITPSKIIWSYLGGTGNYLYCSDSGCLSGIVAVANETDELFWENQTSRTGNVVPSVFPLAIAVYHLEETSGSIAYDSIKIFNGTIGGSPNLASKGLFNKGYNFPAGSNIDTGITNQLNPSAFSVELWANFSAATGSQEMVIQYDTDQRLMLWLVTGNKLRCSIKDSSATQEITYNWVPNVNQWYHIICERNSTHSILYLDGIEVGSVVLTGSVVFSDTVSLKLAYCGDAGCTYGRFSGNLDEVRFWNRTLQQDEVRSHYYNGINNMTRFGAEEEYTTTTTTVLTTTTTTTTTIPTECSGGNCTASGIINNETSCVDCLANLLPCVTICGQYDVCTIDQFCYYALGNYTCGCCCEIPPTTTTTIETTTTTVTTTTITTTTIVYPENCSASCNLLPIYPYGFPSCDLCVENLTEMFGDCDYICRAYVGTLSCANDLYCLPFEQEYYCGCCCSPPPIPPIYGNASYPSGCCPISDVRCRDNQTLVQMWNISSWDNGTVFNISTSFVNCTYGCDMTTNECRTSPIREYSLYGIVILIIIIIIGVIIALYKRV
jgi:hypothetical protein